MKTETNKIENIRAGYLPKETTKFDELKALDKKVKRPANVIAYVCGSVWSLVLGTGMCLAMKVIGSGLSYAMPLGICVGVVGIALMILNYPMHKKILAARKKKYSEQIIKLSDSLLNN